MCAPFRAPYPYIYTSYLPDICLITSSHSLDLYFFISSLKQWIALTHVPSWPVTTTLTLTLARQQLWTRSRARSSSRRTSHRIPTDRCTKCFCSKNSKLQIKGHNWPWSYIGLIHSPFQCYTSNSCMWAKLIKHRNWDTIKISGNAARSNFRGWSTGRAINEQRKKYLRRRGVDRSLCHLKQIGQNLTYSIVHWIHNAAHSHAC